MAPPADETDSGRGLLDAARAAGLEINQPAEPADRFVKTRGLRFHYLDWGNGHLPHLVFLHGFAQQAHSWDFAALSVRDLFHVVSLDLRGHGDSDWSPDGEYRQVDYLTDLDAILEVIGLKQVVLSGLSLGGRLSFLYASEHPEVVQGLIVVDAAPAMQTPGARRIRQFVEGVDEWDSFEEMVRHVARYTRRRRPLEQIRGSLRHSSHRRDDGKWTWKYDPRLRRPRPTRQPSNEGDLWQPLNAVRCPTLFVRGAQSEVVSQETAERAAKAVPGARLEVVDAAGHLVPGDNPVGFANAVRPFLEELAAQS